MDLYNLPDELINEIKSYCKHECVFCNKIILTNNFCSKTCFLKYYFSQIDIIDFVIVMLFSLFIIYRCWKYIIEPFNTMLVIYFYFILIPSWIISSFNSNFSRKIFNRKIRF